MKKILLTSLALALPVTAATVVTNNTGLPSSSIMFADFNGNGATTTTVTEDLAPRVTATVVANISDLGNEGAQIRFGANGYYGTGGETTYQFGGLTQGVTYNVYANWSGNGSVGMVYTGMNAASTTINQTTASSAAGTGFTATSPNNTASAVAQEFQLLGSVTVGAGGTFTLTATKDSTKTYGRWDAVAIAPVPEPSAALLGGLGLLGLLRRRRA